MIWMYSKYLRDSGHRTTSSENLGTLKSSDIAKRECGKWFVICECYLIFYASKDMYPFCPELSTMPIRTLHATSASLISIVV